MLITPAPKLNLTLWWWWGLQMLSKTGFFCVVLAILELDLQTRLASKAEINLLPLLREPDTSNNQPKSSSEIRLDCVGGHSKQSPFPGSPFLCCHVCVNFTEQPISWTTSRVLSLSRAWADAHFAKPWASQQSFLGARDAGVKLVLPSGSISQSLE